MEHSISVGIASAEAVNEKGSSIGNPISVCVCSRRQGIAAGQGLVRMGMLHKIQNYIRFLEEKVDVNPWPQPVGRTGQGISSLLS